MFDSAKVEKIITELLGAFGEDINREGLRDTPRRVTAMYQELLTVNPQNNIKLFNECTYNDYVIINGISFSSLCEHHLLPFVGTVNIAYLPQDTILGVSKFVRIVNTLSKRLQLQERLTNQICKCINNNVDCDGVLVYINAVHMCMAIRGVNAINSNMTTICSSGVFKNDYNKRAEVLGLFKK